VTPAGAVPRPPAARRPRRRWARVAVTVVVALVAGVAMTGVIGALLLRRQFAGAPAAEVRSQGWDALWLGHRWVDGRATAADRQLLVERLRGSGIRDLYLHVGPLADDGGLDRRLSPGLAGFLAWSGRELPGVRVQAWLGNVVGPDRLDVDDPATRRRVVAAAAGVLADGIHGIHTDDGGHHASAETVRTAVLAARIALADDTATGRRVGVAFYADFTATEQDWREYEDGWIRPAGAGG